MTLDFASLAVAEDEAFAAPPYFAGFFDSYFDCFTFAEAPAVSLVLTFSTTFVSVAIAVLLTIASTTNYFFTATTFFSDGFF